MAPSSRLRAAVKFDLVAAEPSRLFWRLQIGGWLGISLFSYLLALVNGKPLDAWKVTVPIYLVGFLGTLGLRLLLRWWRGLPPLPLAAAMLLPAVLVGAAMSATLALAWQFSCAERCDPMRTINWFGAMIGYTYLILAWTFLYISLRVYRQLQLQNRQVMEATAMAHQAQLKMLRYQLNPHFLFNTLNAISTLILDRDNGTANRMLQGLSRFLRRSLDNDPMQRVTLRQELDALMQYLEVEKLRFDERLRIELEVAEDCREALLPSLLLQPLIENAIKHAVACRVDGGTLRIAARRAGRMLELEVADDGPGSGEAGPTPPGNGHGVGLANVRERLRVLYGDEQHFEAGNRQPQGFIVRLALPFEQAAG
jgi:two-component system, LytTR family, sensor kinase